MKRQFFHKLFVPIFILLLASLIPDFATAKVAETGWWLLRRPQSTKPRPVVAVVSAVRGDLSGVFYNPSLLGLLTQREIFTLGEFGLAKDTLGGILYGHPFKNAGLSAGFIYYDAGKMDLWWIEQGEEKHRTATAQRDILGLLSYGHSFFKNKSILAGATFKFTTSNIAETASANAYAFDVGLTYLPPLDGLSISLAGQNIGWSSKFLDRKESLPLSLWCGTSYARPIFKGMFIGFGTDIAYLFKEKRVLPGIGIEYGYRQFGVNLGYRFGQDDSALQIGVTLTLRQTFDFGYAFVPAKYLNNTHRVSFGYRF